MSQISTTTFTRAVLLAATTALPATAQLPGLPTLQNAFFNPGLTAGLNIGGGSGSSAYAAAGSFGAGRIQLAGGVGAFVPDTGSTALAYGARVSMPLLSFLGGSAGVAPFVGAGGASADGVTAVQIPVGAGVGWRRGLGATRGISVYAAPMFTFYRVTVDDSTTTKGLFRASIGLDFAVTRRLGVTLGGEWGASADEGDPGPDGGTAALGISWAFGRR